MHEVLVNRFGGLSLPRKSVIMLTDRPDMTLDIYRGRKTTMQQQQQPTTDRNYSGEQKVSFESPVPVSKCLRANIYCNTNVQFDPQGGQTLLLKMSEPFLLSLGSWTKALNLLLFFHFPGCGERW